MANALWQPKFVDVAALHAEVSGSLLFHDLSNGLHLGSIIDVVLQRLHLGEERLAVLQTRRRCEERRADRG